MSSKLDKEAREGLEATLVERYMQRNGWEFPSGNMDCEDYDAAVKDVKWFMSNLEELGYRKPPDRPLLLSDEEINKAFDEAFDKPISFDHKPTPEEIITIRLRAVAQAQWQADIKQK